jgi:hypothetical protein
LEGPGTRPPTRISAAVFAAKAAVLRVRRACTDVGSGVQRHPRGDIADFPIVLAESHTPLWPEEKLEERAFQLGKVHNLRCALRRLHRAAAPAGATFSFWKQVQRTSRRRGYVAGRMLQQGCLVPSIGGGLCQLSNALYDVCLQADCDILERHAHSSVVPGSAAAIGRDATVAWNYVDLRFRPRQPMLVEALLTKDELIVRLRGQTRTQPVQAPSFMQLETPRAHHPNSCLTCGQQDCFRHAVPPAGIVTLGRTAFLVDECWPEFQDYLRRTRQPEDVLGIPFDGVRWRLPRYRWDTSGYSRVETAPFQTLSRALTSRRLQAQGPARLKAQFAAAEGLADSLAKLLTSDVTSICVTQSLLPFLWNSGHLGGRTVHVLMTRLPIVTLQDRLDHAFHAHPDRLTLHDFRAPDWIATAETEALRHAVEIITPHREVAALFSGKTHILDWSWPQTERVIPTPVRAIAFPGPTTARKGAYELRAAAQALDLEVLLLGSDLEGSDFWRGIRTRRAPATWLTEVAAVVQPALLEDKPRTLIAGLAAGLPVIATEACGLGSHDLLTLIPVGDESALQEALGVVVPCA